MSLDGEVVRVGVRRKELRRTIVRLLLGGLLTRCRLRDRMGLSMLMRE